MIKYFEDFKCILFYMLQMNESNKGYNIFVDLVDFLC